jgi:hypothetical protein
MPLRGTAIVAGWALAQRPEILPGLSVEDAAAAMALAAYDRAHRGDGPHPRA